MAPISTPRTSWGSELLLFSAPTAEALRTVIQKASTRAGDSPLRRWARELDVGVAERHRLAVIAEDVEALRASLARGQDLLSGDAPDPFNLGDGVIYSTVPDGVAGRKTAFLYPGYGAQYSAMLDGLFASLPGLEGWLDGFDERHRRRFRSNPLLFRGEDDPAEAGLAEIIEAVLVSDLAFHRIVTAMGIEPDAMVGHSYGENAALLAAGMVDDYRVLFRILGRIGAAGRVGTDGDVGSSMMAITAAGRSLLENEGLWPVPDVHLALDNCPRQQVLCGADSTVGRLEGFLRDQGELCFRLPHVAQPVHTPDCPVPGDRIEEILGDLPLERGHTEVYSCCSAAPLPAEADGVRSLLARQWSETVRFRETIAAMYADGVRDFVEVGPSGRLTGFVRDILRGTDASALPAHLERRPIARQLQALAARRFCDGRPASISALLDLAPPDDMPARVTANASDTESSALGSGLVHEGSGDLHRLTDLVLTELAELLERTTRDGLDPDGGFFDLGLDSVGAVALAERLGSALQIDLPPTALFDAPTPRSLAHLLAGETGLVDAVDLRSSAPEAPRARQNVPVAIVGIGCRLPGGIHSPSDFWDLLRRGTDGITAVPADRWDPDRLPDPLGNGSVRSCTRWGGFLSDVKGFDAEFFGVSPREARSLDPQQRLLLEVGWEALEDAAIDPSRLQGRRTGIFVGIGSHDYPDRLTPEERLAEGGYLATGTAFSTAAGRLSFVLGSRGPSLAVDTACSSSLVSLHLARRSLQAAESDLALAGGVNLLLSPEASIHLTTAGALSPRGRCHTFDASADGYVRAEGCGILVLKRLDEAIEDGDRIYAVVRGSAVNHDGRTSGLTVPSGSAQEEVIREALRDAGVDPESVGYVEAHGTGTRLGDPIEVRALSRAYGRSEPDAPPLHLGAAKTHVGHLEAAAGVTGVIKAALQLQNRSFVGNLHQNSPNPGIPWAKIPVRVCTSTEPWASDSTPRRAGVSAFGISGTNAHLILEEAPGQSESRDASAGSVAAPSGPELLLTSARTTDALAAVRSGLADELEARPGAAFAPIAATTRVGRAHHRYRGALVVADSEEAVEGLRRPRPSVEDPRAGSSERLRIAFLFTGQGAQRVRMGMELHGVDPAFTSAFDRCAELLQPAMGRSLTELFASGDPDGLNPTEYAQPALFALGWALSEMWRSRGIVPDVVLGHSIGELTAACVAGVLSLPDAARLVVARGQLMGSLPRAGGMLALRTSEDRATEIIRTQGLDVEVAAVNHPAGIVLAGPVTAVEEAHECFESVGIPARRLRVSNAFHSRLMDPILEKFRKVCDGIRFAPPRVPMISNVTGQVAGEEIASADYWVRHLRRPVRFADGVLAALDTGVNVFLELGPDRTLLGLGEASTADRPEHPLWLPSLLPGDGRTADDPRHTGAPLGDRRRYRLGGAATGFGNPPHPHPHLSLPADLLLDRAGTRGQTSRLPRGSGGGHPLAGTRLELPGETGVTRFEGELPVSPPPVSDRYRMGGLDWIPPSSLLEAMLWAAREATGSQSNAVADFVLEAPVPVRSGAPRPIQTLIDARDPAGVRAEVFTHSGEGWVRVAHCTVNSGSPTADLSDEGLPAGDVESDSTVLAGAAFYDRCSKAGIEYGEAWRVVSTLTPAPGVMTAELQLGPATTSGTGVPPLVRLLEGIIQLAGALRAENPDSSALDRVSSIRAIRIHRTPVGRLKAIVEVTGVRVTEVSTGVLVAEVDRVDFVSAPPVAKNPEATSDGVAEILAAGPEEREDRVRSWIRSVVSSSLGIPDAESLPLDLPLPAVGFDSMMALHVGNHLRDRLGIDLPPARWVEAAGITTLATEVAQALGEAGTTGLAVSGPLIDWAEGTL